jgi:RND family efflux transporter MFP subunit
MMRATGTLHARESATISAQVVGRIQQVLVHEGDNVQAGQTLAILDDATLRSASDQAQAGVKAAENQQAAAQAEASLAASTLDRYKQLQAEKSVSPQEMDEVTRRAEAARSRVDAVRAQTDAAKAQGSGARSMLSYTRLRAPFAGVVTARMADPGTMAAPGVPLLQVDSNGLLQLQATIDESAIGSIRKGMKTSIVIDGAPNGEISGTVAEIVPAADPSSHSFLVKIDLARQASYTPACMAARSLQPARIRQFSCRARRWFFAAHFPASMFSMPTVLRNSARSRWARRKASW